MALNKWVRRNALITRLLFGVKIQDRDHIHWDFTTLAIKRCLVEHVKPQQMVLEVGTGPHAILSIYLAKHVTCNILACDINEAYVIAAENAALLNNVSIRFVHSDLFNHIDDKFNTIFWNSVYISRRIGISLGMDKICSIETDWCGGETASESIDRFLQCAADYLQKNGKILLGFNKMYLQESLIVNLCEKHGFMIKDMYSGFPNPSRVAIIGW